MSGTTRPRTRQRTSLRTRISWLVAIAVAVAVGASAFAVFVTARDQLYSRFDAELLGRAQAAVGGALADPNKLLQVPADAFGGAQVGIVNTQGVVYFPNGGIAPPVGPAELAVANGASPQSIRATHVGDTSLRVVAVPTRFNTALVLAASTESVRATLRTLTWVLLLIGLFGVALGAIIGRLVATTALRPIERLTEATERVARTEDLTPVPVEGDDEIARLAQSFNTMLVALESSRDRQRRLIADAGHELRTPLTSLRTNLDLLAQSESLPASKDAPTLSVADHRDLLADVRAQLNELTELVADLTELSKEAPAATAIETFDLRDSVEVSVERVRRRAGGRTFDVVASSWWITGEHASVERSLTNLLDNAVKWSPAESTIHVRLTDGVLAITDEGEGFCDEDLPHVFERFYRSTDARALPGSGLGLAIVAQTVERHGGTVTAANAPQGGAQVIVRLPGSALPPERPANSDDNASRQLPSS